MKNGVNKNYSFGQKNNWRRWQWNIIETALQEQKIPKRDAIVVYLSGLSDIDRDIALQHGFRSENLICVDRDWAVVSHLRSQSKLAVQATLSNFLLNWPCARPAHVVIGDFCGGLTKDNIACTIGLTCNRAFSKAIVAINLLRGRDPLVKQLGWEPKHYRHRGSAFFNIHLGAFEEVSGIKLEGKLGAYFMASIGSAGRSYKSGVQMFDSVIYQNISLQGFSDFLSKIDGSPRDYFTRKQDLKNSLALSINATLAVRTKKILKQSERN